MNLGTLGFPAPFGGIDNYETGNNFGAGLEPFDVTSSRVTGTTYRNNNSYTIWVSSYSAVGIGAIITSNGIVNGVTANYTQLGTGGNGESGVTSVTFPVPPGMTYSTNHNQGLAYWVEYARNISEVGELA